MSEARTGPASSFYVAEPPAAYALRPPMVVDCSAVSAILFDEPARDDALARLTGRSLHAPHLIDQEITSVALKKQRARWPQASIELALADYADYDIERHSVDVRAQFTLANRYGLSAYDAAYLWLAAELKAPLATFDRALAAAAQDHLDSLP